MSRWLRSRLSSAWVMISELTCLSGPTNIQPLMELLFAAFAVWTKAVLGTSAGRTGAYCRLHCIGQVAMGTTQPLILSHQFLSPFKEPIPVASSAYHSCFTLYIVDSSLISGTEATVCHTKFLLLIKTWCKWFR